MIKTKTAVIDGLEIPVNNERNLLELIRKAHIELPTFCYHSDISVYGACRMCMVDVEGRGLVPACSTPADGGLVVRTNTEQIRELRKTIVELLLANHDQNCTTCPKSDSCQLQRIAHRLGIHKVPFKQTAEFPAMDLSSASILRDPKKCVLCGDCVRVCREIQSVGVLDFAGRGAKSVVTPCFDKGLGEVECVGCGQCVKVCPVGALTPALQTDDVWQALYDGSKTVVVQIAPAVRVALGEEFGFTPGATVTGQIVSALRMIGFDRVYDTSFAADLTVIEEGNEFLARYERGEKLPQFTSCCPAWVKFAEQYYPDMLPNLSSCRSPQQMFGSLCKQTLAQDLGLSREDIVVVSIMPCTAKKSEARREEFYTDDNPDVDFVLTTGELALMIKERGIDFSVLDPGSFDMPFGFKSGAGVIFGVSGGVSEAVLRYAGYKLGGDDSSFSQVRGGDGVKTAQVDVGGVSLRLGIVSGLANARRLIDKIRNGEEHFDLIEVMACCGGCINGGGQPVSKERDTTVKRAKGLYDNDKMMQIHSAENNPYLQKLYAESLDEHTAHKLLHTQYHNKKRISGEEIVLESLDDAKITLTICFGTSCFIRGAQQLYTQLMDYLRERGILGETALKVTFCSERCDKGPVLTVNGSVIEHCSIDKAIAAIEANYE